MPRLPSSCLRLSLCALAVLAAGCGRSVDSRVGNAPDLVTWTKSIKDRPPTATPKPLPLLNDTDVFDYNSRSVKSINPNPAAALQRAAANGGGTTSDSALSDDSNSPASSSSSAASADLLPANASAAMAQGLPGLVSLDGHLRDPFSMPITSDTSMNTIRPQTGRPKESLEAFPLDGLKMVGSIGMPPQIMALVQASDRVVYHVEVGQYMGEHEGKVTKIDPDHIELQEIMPNPNGGWTEKAAAVPLSD